jgi:glycosyltransferase involved in cell wall biosynthesis
MTISAHVRRQIEGKTRAKLFDIPNIAAERFFTGQKSQVRNRILYVSRISEEKGLIDLLKAVARIQGELQGFELDVVGQGSGPTGKSYYRQCQEFASTKITSLPVRFLGWQSTDAVAELHGSSCAFVMPSRAKYEGMPVVLAEALAAGTPAIVYDLPPMRDLIEDGVTGYVIPIDEIDALTASLLKLVHNQEMFHTMSENARRKGNLFRGATVAKQVADAYFSILESPRQKTGVFSGDRSFSSANL